MKRTLIRLLTAVFMLLTVLQPVHAEGKTGLTVNDFVSIVSEEANKYGLEVWINDYDALGNITKEKIEKTVEFIRLFGETLHTESRAVEYYHQTDASSRAVVTRTRSGYFDITAAPSGAATIKVDITATINTAYDSVISVSNKSAYQSGIAYFFTSWTTKSITTYLNNPSAGYVKAVVVGDARFDFGPITVNKPNITGSCIIDFR